MEGHPNSRAGPCSGVVDWHKINSILFSADVGFLFHFCFVLAIFFFCLIGFGFGFYWEG